MANCGGTTRRPLVRRRVGRIDSGGAPLERVRAITLGQHGGERVQLYGWLHRLRRVGSIGFLILRDGSGLSQIVIEDAALLAALEACYHESVLRVEGEVIASSQAPGGFEILNPAITIINAAHEPPPIDLFRPTLDAQLPTLLDYASLSLRHPRRRAVFQIAEASRGGFRRTLKQAGFTEIQTPKIVASATESGANVFAVDYFGTPAYLAQSPQFYKQMMVGVFERVFEIGPVFRAEPHSTTRHLNE